MRIADTRVGINGEDKPLRSEGPQDFVVTGVGGIPSEHVTAVAVNVTAVFPTRDGYIQVSPTGRDAGTSSNLNFRAGKADANLVNVAVGNGGKIHLTLLAGQTDVVIDAVGWFDDGTTSDGAQLRSVTPTRALDTRTDRQPLGQQEQRKLTIGGVGEVPTTGVTGVVLNLTAVKPTENTYLTVYPDGTQRPLASNINLTAGDVLANLVMSGVSADGSVDIFNPRGQTDVVVDIFGWYGPAADGATQFHPMTAERLADTRSGLGGQNGPVGQNGSVTFQIAGKVGVPRLV